MACSGRNKAHEAALASLYDGPLEQIARRIIAGMQKEVRRRDLCGKRTRRGGALPISATVGVRCGGKIRSAKRIPIGLAPDQALDARAVGSWPWCRPAATAGSRPSRRTPKFSLVLYNSPP